MEKFKIVIPDNVNRMLPNSVIIAHNKSHNWALIGGRWLEVPKWVNSLADIELIDRLPTIKAPWVQPFTTKFISDSGKEYIIRRHSTGLWTCTCPGYHYHRMCKHIKSVEANLVDSKSTVSKNI